MPAVVHGAQAGDGHAQIGQLRFHDKQRRAAGLEQAEQAVGIFAAAGREAHFGQCALRAR